MNTDITDNTSSISGHRFPLGRWLVCIPVAIPVGLALTLRDALPAWGWMWIIALALFSGAKWLTLSRSWQSTKRINPNRLLAYCFLWPGMDPGAFCAERPVKVPGIRDWAGAAGKTALGAVLTRLSLRLIKSPEALLSGWIGMIGLVLMLHFGLFHLLSLFWRTRGVNAAPIMQSPITATSLRKFWGRSWNAGFSDLMHRYFFHGLARQLGPRPGLFAIFLISAAVHELVISLPARGGYGGPTLYFVIQGFGVLLERGPVGQMLRLGYGLKGWCFVALVTVAPVWLLFHPPFLRNVMLPMLRAFAVIL